MEFEKIIAISGQGSLYTVISRSNNGLIAESLEDKKRIPVFQNMDVSTLEDISIYTESGELPLKEVFVRIFEKEGGKEALDAKADNSTLFAYFETIVPDFDRERVYASHIKKMIKWYNQLVKNNLIDPEKLKSKEETDMVAEVEETEEKKAKTKKTKASDEPGKTEEKKKETKKTAAKPATAKPAKSTGAVKNAPAKKVQAVRKAGGA
ncbi:MAG: DUF5606 domain-containing protein [Flavobacteriales bacterium]|nr:DUF5606 domain-containing protein [Flavobacteriales bacterium]